MEQAPTFEGEIYRLPVRTRPSWLNIEGGIGFFAGAAAGMFTAGIASLLPISIGIGGALLSGAIGKNRMEKECKEGQVIRPPRYVNKTMVAGLFVGIFCAAILTPLFFTGFPILGTVAALSMVAVGAIGGAITGQVEQTKDFERAREYNVIEGLKASERARGIRPPYHTVGGGETRLEDYQRSETPTSPVLWQNRNPKTGELQRRERGSSPGQETAPKARGY